MSQQADGTCSTTAAAAPQRSRVGACEVQIAARTITDGLQVICHDILYTTRSTKMLLYAVMILFNAMHSAFA
jgi:hypothetical protein